MTALSERQTEIVRTLVEQAPDRVVGSLSQALAGATLESALGGVRRLVEGEVADRTLRNTVLQPVVAMCGAAPGDHALVFPTRALAGLWRGLKAVEPDLVERIRTAEAHDLASLHVVDAQDRLAQAGAAG
ncbi:MAG: hypothetical protein U1C74_33020, partial [Phenylobacterium sp.]|nr:hypothetical protein [Phenylobacterium sp.]